MGLVRTIPETNETISKPFGQLFVSLLVSVAVAYFMWYGAHRLNGHTFGKDIVPSSVLIHEVIVFSNATSSVDLKQASLNGCDDMPGEEGALRKAIRSIEI
jgi:hypothetical protein